MDVREKVQIGCDIVIVGGGAAGVAAAVTAARSGQRVVLLEKYGFCGGGAVAGLSGTVCGMYMASDTAAGPEQVVFGFADEFMRLLDSHGGLTAPLKYGKTYTHVHDPAVWRNAADQLLIDAGVEIIFHATVTGVLLDGDRIAGVSAFTKQGPVEVRAAVTIDASGDADVVAMAGLASFVGRDGRVQNPTMIFRLQGVDVARFLATYGVDTIMPVDVTELIQEQNASGAYALPRSKIWLFPTTRPGELLCNCTRVIGADGRELNTLLYRDFTDAKLQGRLQVLEYARFFKDHLSGCQDSYINDTAVQVGVRQTRQVLGRHVLTNSEVVGAVKSADSIAHSPWPIELHAGNKPRVEWILDDHYDVPYDCFVPRDGVGILVAGRCLSAEHEAVASARVTAQCFSYGQAIGLSAALCVQNKLLPHQLSGRDLRTELNLLGAKL
jgi:glycine/D-amino acid oxidase-like deaminating enzyme